MLHVSIRALTPALSIGIRTSSITWMIPFVAGTSGVVTVAVLIFMVVPAMVTVTVLPSTVGIFCSFFNMSDDDSPIVT